MLFCLLQDEISKKCIYSITSVTHIMFQFIVIHILDINYNDRHQKILICINRAQSYFSRKGTCKVMISFLSVRCYITGRVRSSVRSYVPTIYNRPSCNLLLDDSSFTELAARTPRWSSSATALTDRATSSLFLGLLMAHNYDAKWSSHNTSWSCFCANLSHASKRASLCG
jgi:hypothetical protein